MDYLRYLAWAAVAVLMLAHQPITPALMVMALPVPDKASVIACFIGAWLRNLATLIPDLLAPVVVPFALLFTGWEEDRLPRLFAWWDNDVSINGDVRVPSGWALEIVPMADSDAARAMCYWAPGHHPRSFWARYVWLGLRNRASRLNQMLGYSYTDGEPSEQWGDPLTGRDHEGWCLGRVGDAYRLYVVRRFGPVCIRVHYGYKVWPGDYRPRASVVAIAFSLISWTGAK